MIWINFKTYQSGTGEAAVRLAKICADISNQTSVKIFPILQVADIFRVSQVVKIPVWAQHVDNIEFGANTGQTLAEAVQAAGAQGTILNHSENKLPVEVIGEIVTRCRKLKLKTLVCSESVEEGKEIVRLKPDFLAYEPPELIGTDVSVASVRAEVVSEFVRAAGKIPVVIGAGIRQEADIRKGLKLGASGFLVASDVVLAKNPKKELFDLTAGFK